MLRKKALKKIFITTLTMFIILTIYTIPNTNKSNVLRTNLEIEDITNLSTDKVYLLNKDNLLVQVDIFLNKKDKIKGIINYLTISNNKIPINLSGYIPKDTKVLEYSLNDNNLVLNFSKEFLNTDHKDLLVTGLIYSLLELDNINSITIMVEGNLLEGYPKILDKSIGINKEYLLTSRKDINKVVIYYLDNNNYYVPVTKYLNDKRDKVEIIVEELKDNLNSNLISLVNTNTKLIDYYEESNVLFLNFNNKLLDDKSIEDKLLNTIAYSVFDNYDVNMVMFEVNKKRVKYIKRND